VRVADRPLAGQRVDALIGQRGSHEREIDAVHRDGALLEVGVHRRGGIVLEDVEVSEQMADGTVAVPRETLGFVDRLIDAHFVAGVSGEHRQNPIETGLRLCSPDLACGGDGTRVDHGVERAAAGLVEADGVEGIAAGFHADLRQHVFRPAFVEGQAIHKGLGDRLDRELLPRITDLVDEASAVATQTPKCSGSAMASSGM